MMDALPGIWALSPLPALIGLLVLIGVAVIRGSFIPRSSHEREMGQANDRGDEWKEAALEQQTVNAEIRAQNTKLIEAVRTAQEFFAKVSVHDPDDTETFNVAP